jgi:hypothetical protein
MTAFMHQIENAVHAASEEKPAQDGQPAKRGVRRDVDRENGNEKMPDHENE